MATDAQHRGLFPNRPGSDVGTLFAQAQVRARLFGGEPSVRIGRFVLQDRIGGGAMGEVYRAHDPNLARDVAIKLVHHGAQGGAVEQARLIREAQALARLSHPNVVQVYDAGTHGDETFIAMELVSGQTLRQFVTGAATAWDEKLRVHIAAARGLEAAHRAGLVHRDFKPENVIVDGSGVARVLDFGLARADEDVLETLPAGTPREVREILSTSITQTGSVLGTPAYMAPEQWAGDAVTPLSDQYAFCVALWEALYGSRPFEVRAVLAYATIGDPAPSPTPSREVPTEIAAALLRGLNFDPARRFASMGGLIEALERGARPRRSSRFAWVSGGAAALVAGTILVAKPWQDPEPPPEERPSAPVTVQEQEAEPEPAPIDPVGVPTADASVADVQSPLVHRVAPFEDLAEVAARYGVAVEAVVRDNDLSGIGATVRVGDELAITSPTKRPLPHQRIQYVVKDDETTWAALAQRFRIDADALAATNEDIALEPGAQIAIWIDPRPYPRPVTPPTVDFEVVAKPDGVATGYPSRGALVGGIQVPKSGLYVRRSPWAMYGSSHAVASLQRALISFRTEVAYPGTVVLSEMSKRGGGSFRPHRTHQNGREVDIWLPTLPGVFDEEHLGSPERRPLFPEIDWYATWGLVHALVSTGAVKDIFLDWRYQEFLYRAAVTAGASEADLNAIQWPRRSPAGIVIHSKEHLSSIHVRFHCARWEADCRDEQYRVAGD